MQGGNEDSLIERLKNELNSLGNDQNDARYFVIDCDQALSRKLERLGIY